MIILGDDALRSQYVPPKPTVKILKRPSQNSQGSGDGPLLNGEKPKQPIKSLKQVKKSFFNLQKMCTQSYKIELFFKLSFPVPYSWWQMMRVEWDWW